MFLTSFAKIVIYKTYLLIFTAIFLFHIPREPILWISKLKYIFCCWVFLMAFHLFLMVYQGFSMLWGSIPSLVLLKGLWILQFSPKTNRFSRKLWFIIDRPEELKKCQKFLNFVSFATPFAVLFNPIAYIYEATAKCCY